MRTIFFLFFASVLNSFGQGTTPTFQVKTMAELVATPIPTVNNRLTALVSGRLRANDPNGGMFYYEASSSLTTNLGVIFPGAGNHGRWFRQYEGPINAMWFGVDPNSVDNLTALQSAINYTLTTTNRHLYMPAGTYNINGTINLQSAVGGLVIEGDAIGKSIILERGAAGYPIIDAINATRITFRNLEITRADATVPSCAILYGRSDNSISSGEHVFDRLYVHGTFSAAALFGISSEVNTFNDCIFSNDAAATNTLVYCANTATNLVTSPITSPFVSITTAGGAGDGFNTFNHCQFLIYSTNPFSRGLVLEFSQATALNSCFFTGNASTNHIELRKTCVGLTLTDVRQEYAGTQPNGIYLGTADVFLGIHVSGSAIMPLKGIDSATLAGFTMTASHWAGENGLNQNVIDVDIMRATWVNISEAVIPAGRYIIDGIYRARSFDSLSTFINVPQSRLSLAGHVPTQAQELEHLGSGSSFTVVARGPNQATSAPTDAGVHGGSFFAVDSVNALSQGGEYHFGSQNSIKSAIALKMLTVNNDVGDLAFLFRQLPADTNLRMQAILRSGGNFGLGTNLPAEKLYVVGNSTITGTNQFNVSRLWYDGTHFLDTTIDSAGRVTLTPTPLNNAWLNVQGIDGTPNLILKGSGHSLRLTPNANGYEVAALDQTGFGFYTNLNFHGNAMRFDTDFGQVLSLPTEGGATIFPMTSAQRLAIAAPLAGRLVYQSDLTAGFYYWDGAAWQFIAPSGGVTAITNGTSVGTGWPVFSARSGQVLQFNNITNGAALTTTLSSQNIIIDMPNTAVTPGSYADAYVTVDAYGRLTGAVASTNNTTIALTDPVSLVTTGAGKQYWRAPYAFTLKDVRASVSTASTSGGPLTVNIKKNGTTIFSTKLTIDDNEKTSVTAATPYVFSTTAVADDDELTFDIDTAGSGGVGLMVKLYYVRP